jgi:hypothetical protein
MITRSNAEWERLYRQVWRWPYVNLPKDLRAKLVRGCRGKACYETVEEALPVIKGMPLKPGLFLKAYQCPLCFDEVKGTPLFHIGNSRTANTLRERLIDPMKGTAK